jgi:two-component system response regulator DesR
MRENTAVAEAETEAEAPDDDRRLAVLIVDHQEVVLWGFRLMLSRERWVSRCLGASTGEQGVLLADRYRPHVAVVDLALGDETGADVCEQILRVCPRTRVLLMSGTGRMAQGAARSVGASGFVPKGWPAADLMRTIHAVALGRTRFVSSPTQSSIPLSSRELAVLDDLASGATNLEIAERMQISHHTVKEHVSSLYRKLGVRNRTGAVHRARRLGLLA